MTRRGKTTDATRTVQAKRKTLVRTQAHRVKWLGRGPVAQQLVPPPDPPRHDRTPWYTTGNPMPYQGDIYWNEH